MIRLVILTPIKPIFYRFSDLLVVTSFATTDLNIEQEY